MGLEQIKAWLKQYHREALESRRKNEAVGLEVPRASAQGRAWAAEDFAKQFGLILDE